MKHTLSSLNPLVERGFLIHSSESVIQPQGILFTMLANKAKHA